MAIRELTANLAERPRPVIKNLQDFNMLDAYNRYDQIEYKANRGFLAIDSSDKGLKEQYDNYKQDNKVITPLYREVGNRYKKPYLITRSAIDTERTARFIKSPKGALFTLEQTGLQLSQPKSHLLSLQQTRIFNPIQWALNIPGWSIGSHVPRHGVLGLSKNYEYVTELSNNNATNRLLTVYRELGHDQVFNNIIPDTKITKFLNKLRGSVNKVRKFLGINYGGRVIQEYSGVGGPKSYFGVGYTDIRSYDVGVPVDDVNRFSDFDKYKELYSDSEYSEIKDLKIYFYGPAQAFNLSLILSQPGNISATKTTSGFSVGKPFTGYEIEKYNMYQNLGYDEKLFNKHHNYNSKERDGQPLPINNKYNDFRKENKKDYEKENLSRRIGVAETRGKDYIYNPFYETDDQYNNAKDLVRLRFKYADDLEVIQFRGTISGLSNNFSPEWNSTDYVGRPDSVYTYKGVKRTITFSFIVAANSKGEMDVIYKKLNKLAGMTTPDFKDDGHMIGPVIKLRLGNFMNEESGFISSLDFGIDDEFIWDIDREEPMYIRVNLTFDIIGNSTARRGINYFGKIVNDNV